MKKTIITLLALAGVVMGETVPLTLPSNTTATYGIDWQDGNITNILNNIQDKDPGVYVASNINNLSNYGVNGEGTWINTNNVATITLCGRHRAGGDYMALILNPEFTEGTQVSSLTFSAGAISGVVSTYQLQVGICSGEESTLSSVVEYSTDENGASVTLTLSDGFVWKEGDKIVAVLKGGSGNATDAYTISGISITAEAMPPAVPEPATATLSLLALAGLAARRRRK